jgi:hypothetical protein
MKLSHIADRMEMNIRLDGKTPMSYEALRDFADYMTGSDLPPSMLDKLTDMAKRRLQKSAPHLLTT